MPDRQADSPGAPGYSPRFTDLSRAAQVWRMRRVAEVALAGYDLDISRITLLQHWMNTTFRVEARPAGAHPAQTEHYMLRIQRPDFPDTATIESELHWLTALRQDAGLGVPEPVPARDGALLITATAPAVPGLRRCMLFRWVPGRFRGRQLNVGALVRVGMFMARMHRYAEGFTVPAGFVRPRWDLAGLRGAVLGLDSRAAIAALAPADQAVLAATAAQVQQAMDALGEDRATYGLIHGDLHQGNYLFAGNQVPALDAVHAIDFELCGWGHYIYDLAVTVSTLLARVDLPALCTGLLHGYRQVRPLPAAHEALIPTFVAARLYGYAHWLAALQDEAVFGDGARVRVTRQIGYLRQFLAGHPLNQWAAAQPGAKGETEA